LSNGALWISFYFFGLNADLTSMMEVKLVIASITRKGFIEARVSIFRNGGKFLAVFYVLILTQNYFSLERLNLALGVYSM
jgi:hypothetical protein